MVNLHIIVYYVKNMSDSSHDRLIHILNEFAKSYDKLRIYESESCSKDELEKLLVHIRDVAGEIPSMLTIMFKENPSAIPMLQPFIQMLKPPFLQTLHLQLILFSTTLNPDLTWVQTQVKMTIGYMNGDGWVDGIKAMRTFLR